MWQSQPSSNLFTIALTDPGQAAVGALTQEERREYAALPYKGRRRDWLAGRVAAKRAVAERFGIRRVANIRLAPRPRQAPVALAEDAGIWYPLPATVSVGHRCGWGVAGIADSECRIGVDIDRRHAIDAAHARYFLTPSERHALGRGDAAMLWVQKEAAWKMLDLGDSDTFTDLELVFGDDLIARETIVRGHRVSVSAAVWTPGFGLIAAAVWSAKEAA